MHKKTNLWEICLFHSIIKENKGESYDNIKRIFSKNYKPILFFLCVILFLALAEDVFHQEFMHGDVIGYAFISKYLISDTLTPIVKIITQFGNIIFLFLITIGILLVIKNKKIGISILLNLGLITILNLFIKNSLQRPRPTELNIIQESGYSFPSGHSMISMAFYGYLIYLLYKYVKNKYVKWSLITILSILILLIGFSRIYLGVHYASDVLAGFLLSISYLIIYISITKKKGWEE